MRCIKGSQFCLSVKIQKAFTKFVMVKRDKRVFSCAYLQTINFIGLHLLLIVGEESSGYIEWQSVSVCLFFFKQRKKRTRLEKAHQQFISLLRISAFCVSDLPSHALLLVL